MTRRRYREPATDADAVSAASLGGFLFEPEPPPAARSGAVVVSLDVSGMRRRIACSPAAARAYLARPRQYRAAVVSGTELLAADLAGSTSEAPTA